MSMKSKKLLFLGTLGKYSKGISFKMLEIILKIVVIIVSLFFNTNYKLRRIVSPQSAFSLLYNNIFKFNLTPLFIIRLGDNFNG